MKTWLRSTMLTVVLGAAVVGQQAWRDRLQASAAPASTPLASPLAALPLSLGNWQGQDEPITNPRYRYADEHLQRIYVHPTTGQVVSVWMAYSSVGADRGHHPEVCLAVAGQVEDRAVRTTLELPGHDQPVQQYRFVAGNSGQWVFYWHYTLPPPRDEQLDAVQQAYRQLHTRPTSVTIEVFAPETGPSDAEEACNFVGLLDAAVQTQVGPQAVRGSRRLPVTMVPDIE